MDNVIKKYVERMNAYNQWEEEYKLHNQLTVEQKIKQFLELMELAYLIVPKERIEMFHRENTERLIREKKLLLEGYKKFSGKSI